MRPVVTAIVSTYKGGSLIGGCLEDLLQQSMAESLEIIVIDSGSPDFERAIVPAYQQRHPHLHYVRTARRETLYAAWNRAVRLATGKYLTNANVDDRHRWDAFERMVQVMDSNENVALVYGDALRTTVLGENYEEAVNRKRQVIQWPAFRPHRMYLGYGIGSQPMWRADLHDVIGLFDEALEVAGDWDLWLRIAARTNKSIWHIPEPLGLWYDSPETLSRTREDLTKSEVRLVLERYRGELIAKGQLPVGEPWELEMKEHVKHTRAKRLVLFGAGSAGRRALKILRDEGMDVVGFVDNDTAKQGQILEGVPVMAPQQVAEHGVADMVLVTSMYWAEISGQLRDLGLRGGVDFRVCWV